MTHCFRICLAVLFCSNTLATSEAQDVRGPRWTTSRVIGSPDPPAAFELKRVFPALSFEQPVDIAMLPASNRWFVLEVKGKLHTFSNRSNVEKSELVVDLGEAIPDLDRAYGFTFHPKVQKNRFCYISYVGKAGEPEGTRVSRFELTELDPPTIDPTSEKVIIRWLSGGHNGACLKFGPDGYLYISTGDGGPAFPPDPHQSGQDVTNLLSSILRIDVDHSDGDRPYRIPSDNPFVESPPNARGEVWCYGHRNPWKMSFDAETGDLWVGDVGWEMWELVFRVQKGGNYGWSVMEGSQRVHHDRPLGPTPILPPTVEHSHIEARSITGGQVYRGKRFPSLQGWYVYGDYVTGAFWAARPKPNADKDLPPSEQVDVKMIARSPLQVISFAVDDNQELYVMGYGGGIFQLAPNESAKANQQFPTRLSETGLFSDVAAFQVAPGVLPYGIRVEPWADLTTAERHVAVPGDAVLEIETEQNPQVGVIKGNWRFPENAVLMKTISVETIQGMPSSRRRLETQILHRDGAVWRPYTFIWNEAQTDAELAPAEGKQIPLKIDDPFAPGGVHKTNYRIASRSECVMCHTARGGVVYGFRPEQIDRLHPTKRGHQLELFEQWGLFADPVGKHTKFATLQDESASLDERARAYLDVNCAHCHRRGGGGTAALELPYHLTIARTHLTEPPTQGAFNLLGARVVAPGDPFRSVLYYRMAKIGPGHMPHFGAEMVDKKAVKLIGEWIAAMPATEEQDTVLSQLRDRQETALQRWLNGDDQTQKETAVKELLATTSGALLLRGQLEIGVESARLQEAIKLGAAHADPRIRDLFEPYLPPDQRVKRLGAVIDQAQLLRTPGDSLRGKALFDAPVGMQCLNCHQLHGRGKQLGPDLSLVGKRLNRSELLESIVEPSKKIDPKFRAYTLLTSEGVIYTGLLMERTDERIVLKDAMGKRIEVLAADIERFALQQNSFMPELLFRDMTAQQVADLLAYLSSLK